MKLIHDCIRDVMIDIEENLGLNRTVSSREIQIRNSKYSHDDIYYTCQKLKEAGYLNVEFFLDGYAGVESMTYSGHLFLDNIRDNKVWSTTKSILSKFTSTSIGIVENVASQVITNLIVASVAPGSIK